MTRFVRFAAVALAGAALYAAPSLAAEGAAGKWNIVADAQGQEFKSNMTVTEAGGAYTVDVQPDPSGGDGGLGPMKSTVSDVKVEGAVLSFKQHLASDAFNIDLTYKLTVSGDTLAGEANSDFGPTAIKGTRAN